MAIQGTQVPMYTNSHCFYIFQFFNFYMKKKNQNWKETNKNTLNKNKGKHKPRLTQNNKAKHTSNANKNRSGKRESDRITWSHFPSTT